MRRLYPFVAPLLIVLLIAPGPVLAAQAGVVTPAELNQALSARLDSEAEARRSIRTLLQRADVQALAAGYGLDVQRASAAVSTLQGEDLRSLAQRSAVLQSQLEGGDPVIRISLIAALLIVIIVILLVD